MPVFASFRPPDVVTLQHMVQRYIDVRARTDLEGVSICLLHRGRKGKGQKICGILYTETCQRDKTIASWFQTPDKQQNYPVINAWEWVDDPPDTLGRTLCWYLDFIAPSNLGYACYFTVTFIPVTGDGTKSSEYVWMRLGEGGRNFHLFIKPIEIKEP